MPTYSLKDELFNIDTVTELATTLNKVYKDFDSEGYVKTCLDGFPSRELKERMSYMAELLMTYLPDDYIKATDILLKAAQTSEVKDGFVYGAFSEYVAIVGCTDEYLHHSLYMLGEYTKNFSAEFSIRAFLNDFPEVAFNQMLEWSKSDDVDQRRLASEGLRLRLPWGQNIGIDYKQAVEPLEFLFYDTERYVTRSVANHLNDVSKIDPDLVIEILSNWKASKKQDDKEMDYIINHTLRSLIKKGHLGALELLGYKSNLDITVKPIIIKEPALKIGESLSFSFDLIAHEDTKLMVDYIVDYPMKKGRSTKVFKLKKLDIKKDKKVTLFKNHPFRHMTTKKLYSGDYKISIQVNGSVYGEADFSLHVD